MTRMIVATLTLVALAVPAAALAQGGTRVTAPGGISIELPKGWSVLPADPSVAKLHGLAYDRPEFELAARAGGAPFIALAKAPAGQAGITPTIKVHYQRLTDETLGLGPYEIVTAWVDAMRRDFGEIELLDPPALVNFGGVGVHVRVAYRPRSGPGKGREAIAELWVAMYGLYAVSLRADYDSDEMPQTLIEIEGAARSFRMDETGPPPRLYGPYGP